jgi:hypothetical protein
MSVRFLTDYLQAQLEEVAKHKWILSEKEGHDIGWNAALTDFVAKGEAKKFQDRYFKEKHITSLESDMQEALHGDSCLVIEVKVIAHNHENGIEAVLEDNVIKYCFGNKKECPYRKEISTGLRQCGRKYEPAHV